jgi:hypothetical protein
MPGRCRLEDHFSDGGRDVTAAFDPVKIAERRQHPSASPFSNARDAEIVEAAACKPALTRCESGRALHPYHPEPPGQANGFRLLHAVAVIPLRVPLSRTCPVIKSR